MRNLWLITGLGNPGINYSKTRHNIGFRVIDRISEKYNIQLSEKDLYMIGKGVIEGNDCILLKPLTYMNRSGMAVHKALKKNNFLPAESLSNLIVIQDDLDLDTGIIKIRLNGSSGGHRGIESIIQETGTNDFVRVKIGIGRDRGLATEKFVLSCFSVSEQDIIKNAIINGACAVVDIIVSGLVKAMNRYNKRPVASPLNE